MGVRRRVVIGGALAGALAGCSPGGSGPSPGPASGPATPDPTAAPAVVPSAPGPDPADVTALLAARSAGLAAGDLAAAGSVWVAAAREEVLRADQQALAAGLVEWSVADLALDRPGPGGDVLVTGSLQVRVEGEGRPVRGTFAAAAVADGGRWLLAPAADPGTPLPWDLGAVAARAAEGGVLLAVTVDPGPGGPAEEVLDDLAADLATATRTVDTAWGADWPRGTAVVVVPTVELAARLAGLDPARVAVLDALAVGQDARLGDGRPAGVRVVVASERFARLSRAGRRITLTHELVHVATRAGTSVRPADAQDRPLPRWLVEGYADHVARDGSGIAPARLAAVLLDAVEAGAPVEVPADEAFETADATVLQTAYAAAWTLVTSAARRAGTAGVGAWYRALASAPELGGVPAGVGPDRLEAACQAALGRDWATVRAEWVADVTGGLRGWT